jgi:hypothetical protein
MKPLTKTLQLEKILQETILNIQNLIQENAGIEAYKILVDATFKAAAETDASASMTMKVLFNPLMKELNTVFCNALPQVDHIDGYKNEIKVFAPIKFFVDKKSQTGLTRKQDNNAWENFKKNSASIEIQPEELATEKPQTTKANKDNKNTARPAEKPKTVTLDFTTYIDLATELLNGQTWEEIAVGLAMVTYRRDVEIGIDMEFFEDEHDYAIVISSPAKKRDDADKYYRIPTFVKGSLIIDSFEKLKSLMPKDSKAQITRDIEGRKAGNVAYNNTLAKKVMKIYNERVRPILKDAEKDNKHQLRNIGTSFLIQLQRSANGSFVGNDNEYLEFARRCLVHEFEGTTRGYTTWNIINIPQYLHEILDYPIGEIEKTEVIEETTEKLQTSEDLNDMATLLKNILANLTDSPEAFQLAEKVFLGEDGNLKNNETLAVALGRVFKQAAGNVTPDGVILKTTENPKSAETWGNLAKVVDTLIEYNTHTELKYKIEIAPSPLRSFYEVMFNKTVNINDVNNFLAANENLRIKIDEHNKNQEIKPGHNLTWRKSKETVLTNFKTYIK